MRIVAGFILFLLLAGCASKSLIDHSNAYQKLQDALYLYKYKNRPLLAEKYIVQAIKIFKAHDNLRGLSIAYRDYAYYLQSKSVTDNAEKIKKQGFRNRSINYDNRYNKAIFYYDKAITILKGLESSYDILSNLYLSKGYANHLFIKNSNEVCQSFDQSLKANQQHSMLFKESKTVVPKGYGNFEDFIKSVKKEIGCDKIN